MVWIPFEVMLQVAGFALDNAFISMPGVGKSTQLWRQVEGIPMGDPTSPGMTIGALGVMEDEWMESLSASVKERFRAKRYMDDILLVYAKSDEWDHERFVADFTKSGCYHPPLELEDGAKGTFLETTFEWTGDRFRYWLKNDNRVGEEPKVWRYKDWRSHTPFAQKRALITQMMRKVHKMASDERALRQSAIQKLAEFRRLGYPLGLLRGVCNFMGATTSEGAWIGVRNAI